MKIRFDFVTNSSSSSFVIYNITDSDLVNYVKELIDNGKIRDSLQSPYRGTILGYEACEELTVSHNLRVTRQIGQMSTPPYEMQVFGAEETGRYSEKALQADCVKMLKKPVVFEAIETFFNLSLENKTRLNALVEKTITDDKVSCGVFVDETDGGACYMGHMYSLGELRALQEAKAKPDKQKKNSHDESRSALTQAEAATEEAWKLKKMKNGFSVGACSVNEETLTVPAYIDGTPVVTVDKGKKNAFVKKIIIPDTVKRINSGAFPDYVNLEEIVFKSNDTIVSTAAFTNCPLMFDENGCFSANGVLQDCNQTGDIAIGGNVRIIPNDFCAKSSIKDIKNLTVKADVEEIGWGAFEHCEELKSVYLSDSVKHIGNGAFMDCKKLEKVVFGNSIKQIDYIAFSGCLSLKELNFEGTVSEWYSIEKHWEWKHKYEKFIIHCIDGDVEC